jgi:radical SAM-linked protein
MFKVRLQYSKIGKARYISHLDLMAVMRRALLRAGLELKYSEGFNPHPYMSVALPLSVGLGSVCELMDFGLADVIAPDSLPPRINAELPEGLEIANAYMPARKFNDIAWVEISGTLYYDKGAPTRLADRLGERFSEKSVIIAKKTKRGVSDIDIAPFIKGARFSGDDKITMNAMISAQDPSINPDNIISALDGEYSQLAPDFAEFTRIRLFDSEKKDFI